MLHGMNFETRDRWAFLRMINTFRLLPGWTLSTADKYCANFIQESDAADRCRFVPEMDLSEAIQTCRTDLLFTGNFRVATLHLERLKEECRESLFRNTSLWTLESGSSFLTPPRRIADALCLNDCSGNGICDRGNCQHDVKNGDV